jgi:hypothetical protein
VPRVHSVRPEIDPVLDDIVAKALEKNPTDRFQTALEMREALEAWMTAAKAAVRQDEVGALMRGWFATLREEVKRQIQEQMARVEQSTTPKDLAPTSQGRSRLTSTGNLPIIGAAASSDSNSGVVPMPSGQVISGTGAQGERDADAKGGARRGRPILALAAAMAVAAIAVLGLVKYQKAAPSADAVPSSAPASTAAPAQPPSAVAGTAPAPPPASATATGDGTASAASSSAPGASATPVAAGATRRSAGPGATTAPPSRAGGAPAAPASAPQPEVAAAAPGFLTLDTVPWTRVSEGGRALGTTPIIGVSLAPGPHTLSLDNPDDGVHTSVTVTIQSGERASRRMVLKQAQ